jgi:hypothetical protein
VLPGQFREQGGEDVEATERDELFSCRRYHLGIGYVRFHGDCSRDIHFAGNLANLSAPFKITVTTSRRVTYVSHLVPICPVSIYACFYRFQNADITPKNLTNVVQKLLVR